MKRMSSFWKRPEVGYIVPGAINPDDFEAVLLAPLLFFLVFTLCLPKKHCSQVCRAALSLSHLSVYTRRSCQSQPSCGHPCQQICLPSELVCEEHSLLLCLYSGDTSSLSLMERGELRSPYLYQTAYIMFIVSSCLGITSILNRP